MTDGVTCYNNCFHIYGKGPCFDSEDRAMAYKAALDAKRVTYDRDLALAFSK